jgi:sodium transport system permease protein
VQPVPPRAIAISKYLADLIAGMTTLVLNVSSWLLGVFLGWVMLSAMEAGGGGLGLARIAGTLAYLPACVLLAALLCRALVSARTFREGQLTVLPVTLGALVPSAIVLQPELETDWLLAILPLGGPALLMRDALRGSLNLALLVPMTVSHLAYAALLLRSLARALDGERLLASAFVKEEARQRQELGRHELRWCFVSVLTLYVLGGSLQEWRLQTGMLLTFWVLCPLLAVLALRRVRERTGEGWAALMGLRLPRVAHGIGGLLCVPALIQVARTYEHWQRDVLPLPGGSAGLEALGEFLESLSQGHLLFLFAVSPGVCEELLFRGALLAGMRRDFSARRSILWQALYFGAAHASIWRLVPTAFMGGVLTALTLRSRSLWPAVLVHVAYDGLLVSAATSGAPWIEGVWMERAIWLAAPGLCLLLLVRPRGEFAAKQTR